MSRARKVAFMGMFIALEIALTRFVGFLPSTVTRISLSFVAFGSAGLLFGPSFTTITALIGDLIGATLFPQGPFVIGFTISAVATGFIFGQIKKFNKPLELIGIIFICAIVVELGLNTLWLSQMQKLPFLPLMITRLPGIIVNVVLRLLILLPLIKQLKRTELFNEN